jgi:hypothetical protein
MLESTSDNVNWSNFTLVLEVTLASGATALGSVKLSDFAFIKLAHYPTVSSR